MGIFIKNVHVQKLETKHVLTEKSTQKVQIQTQI